MLTTNNFWAQVVLAAILAAVIVAATITAIPTGLLDRATNAAGSAGQVLAGPDDPAHEQARVCWIRIGWCR